MSKSSMVALVLLAALAGCSSATRGADSPREDQGGGDCPIALSGTRVTVVDVPGGVALSFTTIPSNVAELRRRLLRLAETYNDPPSGITPFGGAPLSDPNGATPEGQPSQGVQVQRPPAVASVEEIDFGARLVMTPRDEARLPAMRNQVREDARAMMATRDCP